MGRLAVVGFTGHAVPDELRRIAATFDLAGVIYFARNIVEPRQVAELSREVAALTRTWPLWISVDQEGGRVARLKAPFTEWPPMAALGRAADDGLATRFAKALASELTAVGVTLDYTPVLDVHTNPDNPVIGDRALASRPEDVARLGAAIVRTLQGAGVGACGKHFPGHGDTSVDSHEALPMVEHDMARLMSTELPPFQAAIAQGVAAIMMAHLVVRAVDASRPASVSPAVIQNLLKTGLSFDGVVIGDDLGMKALSHDRPLPQASVAAVAAGCDVLLMCNSTADEQIQALEALIRAAETGVITQARVDDAFARQARVKASLAAAPRRTEHLSVVGCGEHQAIAAEMAGWL